MTATPVARQDGPLGIICGGGSLPLTVADLAAARGRKVVLFALREGANPADFAGRSAHWAHVGQIGKFLRLAHTEGCRDVVFIGTLVRPSLWNLHLDFGGLRVLAKVVRAYRGGDDHLLSGITRVLEDEGLRLVGAHEVAPEILVPDGVLGRVQPNERDRTDIAFGLDYLRAASPFDIGQAVVVAGRHVLAVEAAEGTDAMVQRVADMRASGRVRSPLGTGVLVKAPKRGQDRRFDLPAIGPLTVEGAARAGLAGIAVEAGGAIVAEPQRLIDAADRDKMFVIGVPAGRAP